MLQPELSAVLDCHPMHAELPLDAFVGDHDPVHAQRCMFRLRFHVPGKVLCALDCAFELRRRHRPRSWEKT